jgi:glycosyltransferase involved in cell wall biosynthesis
MKIAMVTATFPPYHGGMGAVAEQHASALAHAGHTVVVYTPSFGATGIAVEQRGGFVIRRLRPLVRIGNGAVLPQLVRLLGGSEVVFLHYPAFGLVASTLLWAWTKGRTKKVFIYYHMDPVATGLRGMIFRLLTAVIDPFFFRRADRIIVSSLDYAELSALTRHGTVLKKTNVVPIGVDTKLFSPGVCTQPSKMEFRLGEKNLLFVGGMDRAHDFKGIPELIRAFATSHVHDALLHLVGDGELREQYAAEAGALGIGERVRFHGALSREALIRLYRCVDVVVLPSRGRSEAFGMVLLEAMASGIPVIASRLPGVRTLVVEGKTGWLVQPGDIEELAAALRDVCVDGARASYMGRAARERVVTEYGIDVVTKQLRALL